MANDDIIVLGDPNASLRGVSSIVTLKPGELDYSEIIGNNDKAGSGDSSVKDEDGSGKNTNSDYADIENKFLRMATIYVDTGDMYEAVCSGGYDGKSRSEQRRYIRYLLDSSKFRESIELACERALAGVLTAARRGAVPLSAITAAKMTYEYFCGRPPKKAALLDKVTDESVKEEKW